MILNLSIGDRARKPDNIQTAVSQQQLVNSLLSERLPQNTGAAVPQGQPQPQPAG